MRTRETASDGQTALFRYFTESHEKPPESEKESWCLDKLGLYGPHALKGFRFMTAGPGRGPVIMASTGSWTAAVAFAVFFSPPLAAGPAGRNGSDDAQAGCGQFAKGTPGRSACELSERFGVPFDRTMMVIALAAAETSSASCRHRLADDFGDIKDHAIDSEESFSMYRFLMENTDTSETRDPNLWCGPLYSLFGPDSPPGPDGWDTRLLK